MSMTLNDYQQAMQRTYKPERKPNHALGVAGEVAETAGERQHYGHFDDKDVQALLGAGRLSETVKKDYYHKRELTDVQRTALLKELGDILWYVAALATDYGFTLEQVARTNVEKLQTRYPAGFVQGGGIRKEQDNG